MSTRGFGSYDQYMEDIASYNSALTRGTDENKPVKMSTSETVVLAGDGDNFSGVVRTIAQNDKVAGVQEDGYVELPYTGSAPSLGWNFLQADAANGVKVATLPNPADSLVKKTITVATGAATGSSAADATLVGGQLVGQYPTTNQDQLIDNIVLNADGSITVTLAANATADNTINVVVEKASPGDLNEATWPNRYHVRKVDTVGKLVTFRLS